MLDQDAAQLIARQLRSLCKPDEITAAIEKYYEPDWPTTYRNAATGTVYKPHHDAEAQFVFGDTPLNALIKGGEGAGKSVAAIVKTLNRLERGMSGIMICLGAGTLVDGIPIAERAIPAPVNTLFGPALASPSFCEGRADLFRVVTESGDQVVATANHRFLTPVGWRPLRDLRVGSLIAVDDSDHGRFWREISPGSLADCWLGPRPSDEPASPGERYTQGKQLLLDGEKASTLSLARDCRAHVCTDHFSCPPILVADAGGRQISFGVGRSESGKCCVLREFPLCASRTDNLPRYYHDPTSHSLGSDAKRQNDHAGESLCSPGPRSIPPDGQCPVSLAPGQTELQSHRGCTCVDLPCPYYNIKWGRLSSITFQRHGDFYGLTVPSVGHYSAQGVFHHNSPDLPHFKRSLWPEFSRWCPWDQVVPEHRYRSKFSWEPRAPFALAFRNGTTLMCGGIDDPGAWEGPNVNFAYFDEARRKKTPAALKVLTGRVRIPGPKGEPPQLFISTTPRKHWLYEYYGPLKCRCESCSKRFEHYANTQAGQNYLNLCPSVLPLCPHCGSRNYHTDDEHGEFKLKALVVTLLTVENELNLQEGFADDRALTLTSAEARVLLEAEWEDVEAGERFLPNMLLWDKCREDLPALTPREPLVVALDAATGRQDSASDCFGIVGVTRHPDPARHKDTVAVRYVQKWQARPGRSIDFQGTESNPGPERVLRALVKQYNVVAVPYDPYQLHDMATRLSQERVAWMFKFTQTGRRIQADTDLLNLITHRRLAHDGNRDLRDHIDNADRKLDAMGKKLRIVKREESLKVDLAICLSQASYECLRLIL